MTILRVQCTKKPLLKDCSDNHSNNQVWSYTIPCIYLWDILKPLLKDGIRDYNMLFNVTFKLGVGLGSIRSLALVCCVVRSIVEQAKLAFVWTTT